MPFFVKHVEILAGTASAAVILVGVIVIGAPLWLSLVVGGSLFLGLYLIGSYWTDLIIGAQAARIDAGAIHRRITAGSEKVEEIRVLAGKVPDPVVSGQVLRICDMAQKIFANFEQDPSDAARASRFLLYLDRFLPLIERYTRLSSTAAGRQLLERSGNDQEFREVLDTVEQGFTQGFQNYLQNDVMEMRTFGRVLKKMMNVAEIGK